MPADPKQVKLLFLGATEQPASGRAAYLDAACGGDQELRQRVERLLDAHDAGSEFLEQPAIGTVDLPPPTQAAGTRLGPYKLLRQIGEGGMGTVWLAEQQEPVKRLVALKLIKAGLDSAQVLARLEQERQALALMDHPHIAKVLDAGTTATGRHYFVMELVKGIPITRYCDEHQLPPRERLELMVPVCQAIQHAHQKGIIHRDIKPSNVLVASYDGKPVVKVIDFGVAKATGQKLTERTLFTGFGGVVGTLEYMAPEQAAFNALDIDTRADIYALGVLLYELLTGTTPLTRQRLKEAALAEALRLIREEEPPRPSTRLSESKDSLPTVAAQRKTEPAKLTRLVRGELDWLVMKALDKDRNRRYETANAFALDIQRYLADEPVLASPPSAVYRLRKFARRHRGPLLAAALLLLALLAGLVGTGVSLVRAYAAEAEARDQAAAAEQARQAEAVQRALAEGARDAKEKARAHAAAKEQEARQAAAAQALAAEAERQAKLQAQQRLRQIEKAKAILTSIFRDLNPRLERQGGPPLQAQLGSRLDQAAALLEEEAVGDPLEVARLQLTLSAAQVNLGYPERAIALCHKAHKTLEVLLGPSHPDTLRSLNDLASAYKVAGQLHKALALYEQALASHQAHLGAGHRHTLIAKSNLAEAYLAVGYRDKALKLHEETLALRKTHLGADHLDTLASMANLAATYLAAGQPHRAVALCETALPMMAAALGTDHPDTLTLMNNLAGAYQAVGRLDQALPLFEEVLAKQKAKLGTDHPDTLTSMGNLATAYQAAGQLSRALPLLEQTLVTTQARLGPDHPDTLRSMSNLAVAYKDDGQLARALPLLEQTLTRMQAKYGAEHPDTLTSMGNLAAGYLAAGQPGKALPLFERALEKLQARLGADHPVTLATMNNLAQGYQAVGQLGKALPLLEQTLAHSKAKLGADHPDTLRSMNNLAAAYWKAGQLDKATPLLEEALQKQQVKPGADHPDTLTTMHNLASAYYAAGQLERAALLLEETLARRKVRLGKDHPDTLQSMNNLGTVYKTAGLTAKALPLFEEALQKRQATLGPDHPVTLDTMNNLASAYFQAQRFADAEPLWEQWLARQRLKLAADDLRLLWPLTLLGECRLMQKKYVAAEQPLRESLAVYQKKHPKTLLRYGTESLLGAALAGQEKYADAEPLLVNSAREMLAAAGHLPPADRRLLVACVQRVVDLYDAWQRPDDAAVWRKHLQTLKQARSRRAQLP
jgi:serine/threonine protein kinase